MKILTWMREDLPFKRAVNYLDSFVNYERRVRFSSRQAWKLKRMRALLEELRLDLSSLNFIHVAGTKGKGSVAVFIAYILAQAGRRVGLYTSPHFLDFRERIRIITFQRRGSKSVLKNFLISRKDVVESVESLKPHLERLANKKGLGRLSFFEVYTALAFKYFLKKKLDFVVLECGLGGRLDATNIVFPLLAVITPIDYDHQRQLGRTLKEIASQKAGIIKKNVPVVTAFQRKEALEVLKKKARRFNSEIFIEGEDFYFSSPVLKNSLSFFDFHSRFGCFKRLELKLKGLHQIANASLAIFSTLVLRKKGYCFVEYPTIFQAVKRVNIEGRLEVVSEVPLIILDTAHNPLAIKRLDEAIKTYWPEYKVILIFGAVKDKDVRRMLKNIDFYEIILTKINNPRALKPEEIRKKTGLNKSYQVESVWEAWKLARILSSRDKDKYLILITGSFFLVAEVKALLKRKDG